MCVCDFELVNNRRGKGKIASLTPSAIRPRLLWVKEEKNGGNGHTTSLNM